jgi:hypothetical protein
MAICHQAVPELEAKGGEGHHVACFAVASNEREPA